MAEYKDNPFSFWMRGSTLETWAEQMELPLTDDKPEFAWVDIETSGLDRRYDRIFELGIVLTNGIGEICRTGAIDWRVFVHDFESSKYSQYRMALDRAQENPIVKVMHETSGLFKDLSSDALHPLHHRAHPGNVQVEAREWLAEVAGDNGAGKNLQLSGNSPHFDRGFIEDQMPYLNGWFHYRSGVDASALRETFKRVSPNVVASQPQKCKKHRPLPDLADSIRLYRHMLKTGFMLDPDIRMRLDGTNQVDEIDRNARAYGWEVGRGAPIQFGPIPTSADNPFLERNWRDGIVE